MRWLKLLLPLSLLATACAPAVLPGLRTDVPLLRISLTGSSLSVSLSGKITTQALPAAWDSARIVVSSYNLKQPLDSGILLASATPLTHTFNVPPGMVSVRVDLLHSGQVVASGSSEAQVGPGANSVTIELSTVLSTIVTFAGNGMDAFADGMGTEARFNAPRGLALDDQGNLYVADYGNSSIRKVAPDGQVSTIAGADQFQGPTGLAFDAASRRLYVSDRLRHEIRVLHLDQNPGDQGFVTTLAGAGQEGDVDGLGSEATFSSPEGLALFGDFLFVADTGNHKVRQIDRFNGGVATYAGHAGPGYQDGFIQTARFMAPRGVTMAPSGRLYVADTGNHAIREIGGGLVSTVAGGPTSGKAVGTGGPGGTTRFHDPAAVIWGGRGTWAGSLFILDQRNYRICRLDLGLLEDDADYVTEFMGGGGSGMGEGPPGGASFVWPYGMVVEPIPPQSQSQATYFYVADTDNHRIVRGVFAGVGPQVP
ncbi:NHL repeat protein [compost metagenome]